MTFQLVLSRLFLTTVSLAYFVAESNPTMSVSWAYGVTTVPSRVNDLLPSTLASLKRAGFDKPVLFIDGDKNHFTYSSLDLDYTLRRPNVRTAGNWTLSMLELYIREPTADRYAIFQDDLVTYPHPKHHKTMCL